jgi:hypothetical protein
MEKIQIELPPGYVLLRLLLPVQPALFWLASAAAAGFLSATGTRLSASAALTGWLLFLGATGTLLTASAGLSFLFTTSNSEART